MADTAAVTRRLAKFYAELSSLEGITAALSAAGVEPARPRARDLYTRGLDCHNLGMYPMLEVLATAAEEYGAPGPDDTVLDLGCGMGGPGRFLADRFGCSVVGVDLLPLRIDIAQALTDRTGLSGRISYRVADATDLPHSEGGAFAQVWMLDTGIHIRDKHALFGEIARVLQPGGLLVMHDQLGPLPKAMLPVTRRAPYIAPSLPRLIRHVEGAGLGVLAWRDTTRRVLDFFVAARAGFAGTPDATSSGLSPRQVERTMAVVDAYIATLADLGGRTGILIADRPA